MDLSKETWRKSSYSGGTSANCVEVANAPGVFAVRDTQHPQLGTLAFSSSEWHAFVDAAKDRHL